MSDTPRRAPLETMTEEQFRFAFTVRNYSAEPHERGYFTPAQMQAVHAELEAQRLARARARREALEDVWHIVMRRCCDDDSALDSLIGIQGDVKALRDREEA